MLAEHQNGKIMEIENSLKLEMVNGRLRCSLNGNYFEYSDYDKTLSHVSCYREGSVIRGTLYKNGQQFSYFEEAR